MTASATQTGTPLTDEQRQWFADRQDVSGDRCDRTRVRLANLAIGSARPSGRLADGFDLAAAAEVAAAEELHRLTVRLAGAAARPDMTVETIQRVLLDGLIAGADDQMSGRNGDLRRTIHDAVRDDVRQVRDYLRRGA